MIMNNIKTRTRMVILILSFMLTSLLIGGYALYSMYLINQEIDKIAMADLSLTKLIKEAKLIKEVKEYKL